jgi:hypothetical protein
MKGCEHAPPFLLGAVDEGPPPAAADAGIGKAAVDAAERIEGCLHRGLDGSRIGDIADVRIDLAGTGRHGCGRALVLLGVAAPDRNVAALRVQRLRDAKADAAIAAGDDRRAAGEVKDAHGMFPFCLGKLEHDPEKWTPVFRKRSCSNNNRFAPGGGQMFWSKHGQARPENQIWGETSGPIFRAAK